MAEILTIHYSSSHLRSEVSMYLKTKNIAAGHDLDGGRAVELSSMLLDAHLLASSRRATHTKKYSD